MPRAPSKPAPAPLEIDDVRIVAAGTVLWVVALVVVLAGFSGTLDRHGQYWVIWMCVAGAVLGLIGVAYCARRRRRLRGAQSA